MMVSSSGVSRRVSRGREGSSKVGVRSRRGARAGGVAAWRFVLSGLGTFGIVGLGAGAADAAPAPVCSVETCTQAFNPTGSLQTFTVPAGVTSLAITAQGAAAPDYANAGPVAGGVSSGTLVTQPGTSYGVLVGTVGSAGTYNAAAGPAASGGGGAGGNAP